MSEPVPTGVQYVVMWPALMESPDVELPLIRRGPGDFPVCLGLFDVRNDDDYTTRMVVNHSDPSAQELVADRWITVTIPWEDWWP